MRLIILYLFFAFSAFGQQEVLVLGNHSPLCFCDSVHFERSDSLPSTLNPYGTIMLFSGATSQLSEDDLDRIVRFVELGGGLYSGSENWPLQAESNQVTHRLYKKESFGRFETHEAEANTPSGNLHLDSLAKIPAGTTPVAFPMDHRLKVEAWVDDQPLILSGTIEKGRIIIDGGYSRFYCNQRSEYTDILLNEFLLYLLGK